MARARIGRLKQAREGLPRDASDSGSVRAFGYQGIIDLQDNLLKSQASSQQSEDQVALLQRKINAAMKQRNALLGAQSSRVLEQEEKEAAVAAENAAATRVSRSSSRSEEPNEVELFQQGAAKAGGALAGLGKALVKTVLGEEGVGDALRAAGEDATAAAGSVSSAGHSFLEKK